MNGNIVIPLSIFLAIFGIFYIYLTTRNRERMAMIEKGFDPIKFKAKPQGVCGNFYTLRISLLFVGAALGVLFGALLDKYTELADGASYLSMIFLFGGLGLLTAYFMSKKEENKE